MTITEPASVQDISSGLTGVGYLPGESTALVSFLATKLGKPVLVEGPAGVGKTELTEALKRRCLYLWLDYPDLEHELRIVHLHSPELDEQVARKLVEIVHRIRELDLKKPPSIAESIDWARTLILLGASDIDRGTFEETMSVILKHRTDMDTVASRVGVMLDPAADAQPAA